MKLQKWENSVRYMIKKKLKREFEGTESVIDVYLHNRVSDEYSVQLSNSRCLVVNLANSTCSCQW